MHFILHVTTAYLQYVFNVLNFSARFLHFLIHVGHLLKIHHQMMLQFKKKTQLFGVNNDDIKILAVDQHACSVSLVITDSVPFKYGVFPRTATI